MAGARCHGGHRRTRDHRLTDTKDGVITSTGHVRTDGLACHRGPRRPPGHRLTVASAGRNSARTRTGARSASGVAGRGGARCSSALPVVARRFGIRCDHCRLSAAELAAAAGVLIGLRRQARPCCGSRDGAAPRRRRDHPPAGEGQREGDGAQPCSRSRSRSPAWWAMPSPARSVSAAATRGASASLRPRRP